MTPSQIGIVLRDSYGIAQVKSVTGNKILRILKTASESALCVVRLSRVALRGSLSVIDRERTWLLIANTPTTDLAPELPEDLYHLIKKAVAIHKHLASNRKDMDSKFRMVLIEARIHRYARSRIVARPCPDGVVAIAVLHDTTSAPDSCPRTSSTRRTRLRPSSRRLLAVLLHLVIPSRLGAEETSG